MNVLIIGSEGFIGSHCMNFFSQKGFNVTGCDIYECSDHKNYISFKEGMNHFNGVFSSAKYDYCINAAGSARVDYSFKYPEKDFELNVSLVINLLGAIKNNSPDCRFINFSSAAVYGNPSDFPIKEVSDTKPLSPYGYHKLLSENLLIEYHKFFKLKTCSLRVFSAYGEGLKKQLFWDLYEKLQGADTIQLYGTGNESRDFIYIKDLVDVVDLVMTHAQFEGEIYNIANGEEVLIKDAVSVFLKEFKGGGEAVFSGDIKVGDPVNWQADISKIRSLGYVRKYSFNEGLKNYCQWLKEKK